jgi:hypothetical protein
MTKKLPILLIVLVVGFLLVPLVANALPKGDVAYRLYHKEGSNWVRYLPSSSFPPGGANPGTNLWKYEYTVWNVAFAADIYQFYAFFNSENVDSIAVYSSAVAPANWTVLYYPPVAPNYNWKERFKTTVVAARIKPGNSLSGFAIEFRWRNPAALPGVQMYELTTANDSETSQYTHDQDATPVDSTTWGRIKGLFSR